MVEGRGAQGIGRICNRLLRSESKSVALPEMPTFSEKIKEFYKRRMSQAAIEALPTWPFHGADGRSAPRPACFAARNGKTQAQVERLTLR